jgi:hypothetical protein
MRLRAPSIALMPIFIAATLSCQQSPTPRGLLASSISAMAGTMTKSISLTGTAEYVAGSTDDQGSFSAHCAVDGSSRLELQTPSFSRTETRSITNGARGGTWTDEQGRSHALAGHNAMTPATWFCPSVFIANVLADSTLDVEYVGQESRDGESVDHLYVSARPLDETRVQQWMANLTRTDIFLDSATLRPVAIAFNLHPDNNAAVNIPAEIRFGGYTDSSGVWLPSTIEKDVNSLPMLTLTVGSSSPSPQLIAGN